MNIYYVWKEYVSAMFCISIGVNSKKMIFTFGIIQFELFYLCRNYSSERLSDLAYSRTVSSQNL